MDQSIKALKEFPAHYTKFKSIEAINNSIYILGGYDSIQQVIVPFCYIFSSSQKLLEVPPMSTPRISFSLAILGSFLFVVGGFNDGTLGTFEKLHLTLHTWSPAPPLNINRCNPILCPFDGNTLYAFGGTDGHTPLNSIEMFSESTQGWRLLSPIIQTNYAVARNGGYAHQISGQDILIFGGKGVVYKQPIQQCYVFNTMKKEFVGSLQMESESFDNVGIHLEHEKLYVLGSCAQLYNCRTKLWSLAQ